MTPDAPEQTVPAWTPRPHAEAVAEHRARLGVAAPDRTGWDPLAEDLPAMVPPIPRPRRRSRRDGVGFGRAMLWCATTATVTAAVTFVGTARADAAPDPCTVLVHAVRAHGACP